MILFLAVSAAEMEMEIAPYILFLAATAASTGIMWQALASSRNAECMSGLFMLPFTNRKMTFSIVLSYAGYTMVTKTLLVLTLFFAVCEWSALQMAVALLCACNGCFMAAAWYTMVKQRRLLPFVILWGAGIFVFVFTVREIRVFAVIVLLSLLLSALRLLKVDAYVFYNPGSAKPLIRHTKGTGSILLYMLRYLFTNKNYLLNTAGLCVIAVVLCIRYCLFIFSVNMAVSSLYLISWHIQHGGAGGTEIAAALMTALQSAVLSVWLEWSHPVRNWKIENDLWHHPRKYIVPLIMFLVAGLIGMWSINIWILLCIVTADVLSLSLVVRRI